MHGFCVKLFVDKLYKYCYFHRITTNLNWFFTTKNSEKTKRMKTYKIVFI